MPTVVAFLFYLSVRLLMFGGLSIKDVIEEQLHYKKDARVVTSSILDKD